MDIDEASDAGRQYLNAVIGLPANIFFGTSIPVH